METLQLDKYKDKSALSAVFKNATTQLNEQVDIIIRQLASRDIEVSFKKQIEATKTITYFFEPKKARLSDIVKIDSTIRRILEIVLKATSITVIAPVPGTAQIAIVVPKKHFEPVRLSRFIDTINHGNYKIPFILGEDYLGNSKVLDLAKCHHQLIAGATGSGKSNSLKAIISAIAATCDSNLLKLVLIDGKGVDLAVFNSLPHMLFPVITDSYKAIKALDYLQEEMQHRQAFLKRHVFSDIWAYNEACKGSDTQDIKDQLPSILLVIDEVQFLVNGKGKKAEELLRTLTQQGRACGIIIVLATQRPSTDIIQGSIKTNLSGRVAFHLPSQIDSRVILDQCGAELLQDKGDLLTSQVIYNKPERLQAPYISDQEIKDICQSFNDNDLDKPKANHTVDTSKKNVSNEVPTIVIPATTSKSKKDNNKEYNISLSGFIKVRMQKEDLAIYLEKLYPNRRWLLSMEYIPCIYANARLGRRTRKILYDIDHSAFIKKIDPLTLIHTQKISELNKQQVELFKTLQGIKQQYFQLDKLDLPNIAPDDVEMLVRKGLLGKIRAGFYILKNYKLPPIYPCRLNLADVISLLSMKAMSLQYKSNPIEEVRMHLYTTWQATIEDYLYVGLPVYVATNSNGDNLVFPANLSLWKIKISNFLKKLLAQQRIQR